MTLSSWFLASHRLRPAHFSRLDLVGAAILSAGIFMGLAGSLQAADPNEFEVFNYDKRQDGSIELPGRLYVPADASIGAGKSLIVFFHGQGETGNDNTSQVNGNINNLLATAKANDSFLYAPQLFGGANSWNVASIDDTMRQVSNAIRDYNIDPNRVYVVGYSLGGGAAWNTAARYDGALAAVVPIAGSTIGGVQYGNLVDLPIWAQHARNDGTVGVSASRNQVNNIRTADGLATLSFPASNDTTTTFYHDENSLRYTERATGGHGIVGAVTGDAAVTGWMLSQAKTSGGTAVQLGEKIRVDFGHIRPTYDSSPLVQDDIPDSEGRFWNSTAVYQEHTLGSALPYALTEAGRMTAVSLDVAANFNWHESDGRTDAGAPFDLGIGDDGWTTIANTAGTLLIRGLTPGENYQIEIYASNTNSDGGRGRQTRYQIGDLYYDLEAYNNLDTMVTFDSVQSDAKGWITLDVMPMPGGTSRYAQINTLTLTAVPEPGVIAFLVVAFGFLLVCYSSKNCSRRLRSASATF